MDVLLFQVHDQIYAVDADSVKEVVDPVPVTPLPFVPDSVEGLVNISGRVIPQICVSKRLGFPSTLQGGEGTIMLLSSGERLCACRVARVVAKISMEQEAISASASEVDDAAQRLLAGEFSWNDRLVVLLDPAGLMVEQGMKIAGEAEGDGLLADYSDDAAQALSEVANDFPCVLFSSNNELFAFRFDDVAEVIESSKVTPIPGAPSEMAGVLLLRGFPLPVVSMRAILFGSVEEQAPFVLVVGVNGCPLGLQVEKVLGIQRFSRGSLRPLLEEQSILEGFLTTPDNRLVGVIRFSALAEPHYFDSWKRFLVSSDCATAINSGVSDSLERILMFRHGKEMMGVPLDSVERIEEYVEPTETPGADSGNICGVIQVQGNVTPVVILERLTGVSCGAPTAFLILREGETRIAMPVEKVDKVVNLRNQDIDPVRSGQQSLLSGVGKYQGMLVSLLSIERLLHI